LSEVRAPNYELAEKDYMGGMKYKDIAEKYSVSINTVKSWKTRYKWSKDNKKSMHTRENKVCTQKEPMSKPFDDGTRETMLNENLTHEQRLFCIYYSKIFNAAQSYQKAYGCTYESAVVNGSRLLTNDKVKEEIQRLSELKRQQIIVNESDLVELHMRIAFADIGNYLAFGQEDRENENGTYKANFVSLKDSSKVDTQLIQEVKQGREGVSIKLADKQRSLDWLEKHFLMNPMDKHKIDYDNKKLEFEHKKIEPEQVSSDGIKEFLKAIRPSEEDLKELFADEEVIEDGEETTEE
jgi:phage terminase small subunit